MRMDKGMYGLKEARIIANQELVKHMAPFGYHPVQHTPGLWVHDNRHTIFSLVVDNFCVQYFSIEDANLDPGVDTTLLKTRFSVLTDAVGALRFPAKSNKFPPTVNLVHSLSSFSCFTSHNILPYVNFYLWELCFGNKNNCICLFHSSDTLG